MTTTRRKVGRPRKRRNVTAHPGIKLKYLPRTGQWVARWIEPETGAERQQCLSGKELGLTNEQARRNWAIAKSEELQATRAELSSGRPKPERKIQLTEAVTEYLESLTRKRSRTIDIYGRNLQQMLGWARKERVVYVQELTGRHMNSLCRYLHNLKAKQNATGRGVGRKYRRKSDNLLAPASVNQIIRSVRTFLRYCRADDLTPELNSDIIRERLRFVESEQSPVTFLKAREVRALIEACQRHDSATYRRYRWQSTVHYDPIMPFVVACLLGGFRFSELASLRWADCDFETGELSIRASATKTRQGRTVTLRESPALLAILERLKLQAGNAVYVFGGDEPMRRDKAEAARRRLQTTFGAPTFTWHDLRRTCASFSVNMPEANLRRVTKRLGHSIAIADKLYWEAIEVPEQARTIEAAMGIESILINQNFDAIKPVVDQGVA